MNEFIDQALLKPLQLLGHQLLTVLPNVLAMGIILLGGLFTAWASGFFVERLLRVIGFDHLCDRLGMNAALLRGGVKTDPSRLVGRGIYWTVTVLASIRESIESRAVTTESRRAGTIFVEIAPSTCGPGSPKRSASQSATRPPGNGMRSTSSTRMRCGCRTPTAAAIVHCSASSGRPSASTRRRCHAAHAVTSGVASGSSRRGLRAISIRRC